MLYLRGGMWKDKRIVSQEWVKASTQNIMKTSGEYGDFDYGYHLWVGKKQPSFLFNGMYGQNVLGFFGSDILIVSNAGNNEFFQKGAYYDIAEKYFGAYSPAERLPRNPSSENSLRALEKSLKEPPQPLITKILGILHPLPPQCALLDGKVFTADGKSRIVGLLPLMAQVLQNNFSRGIKAFAFSVQKNVFTLTVEENDAKYNVPIGFSEAKYTTLDIHGEPYILGTQGVFRKNEDGNTVLKLKLSFLEISNSRDLKLTFDGDSLKAEFAEHPGLPQIKMYMNSLGTIGKLLDSLVSKLDPDFLDFKLKSVFEPVITFSLAEK
jgi:hypothetical protein